MLTVAAVVLLLLLGALAVFQVVLACGAPLGRFAWGGQHRVLPTSLRVGSILSIAVYAVVAIVVADRAELVSIGVPDVAAWVVTGYFVLGIAMNAASRSPAERAVMTPLCALLAVLSGVVALG